MSNVAANINILVNTSQATAQIRALQAQIATLNTTLASGGKASAASMASLQSTFAQTAVASGHFNAKVVPMTHSVDQFSKSLDRGKLSLGQYTRGVMSQMPMMSKRFRREFDMMASVAESRVKRMQTQYMALGNSQKALALTPTALNMKDFSTQAALATQRQMMMNRMISDGSTKLVNWGKNTQWAGRQLMVGFTMPLMIFGGVAAKTFMDLDKQARDFKRVYGDAFTPPAEIQANMKAIQELGAEYTKYGIKLSETMEVAATAAAAGMRNEQLMAGTEETLRLATIGQIDYNQSLQTTITLQNAFRVANEDMASTVDFIGAVANQTVLTVDDMTKAIPRVAPVIAGLGGDIKDLAALLTAMREGGVSAEQGANALKSGLASLINPTKRAREALAGMGIDIDAIIQANRGDLMGTIQTFAQALSSLDSFSRQQALEKTFGKYQYARLGALFDNISKKGTQAATVLDLAGKSAEELGALSQKSLNEVEQSVTAKFQGAVERMKIAIAPVGEAFLKALTPIIEFIAKIAEKFNELPDNIKNVIGTVAAFGGLVAPGVIMLVGLFANFFGMFIKGIQGLRRFYAWINKNSAAFKWLAAEEYDTVAAATSLEGKTQGLTTKLMLQQEAVATLSMLYSDLAKKAGALATAMGRIPPGVVPVMAGGKGMAASTAAKPPLKAATGITMVPGKGNKDTVPALLTPGESVVTKEATSKYAPIISAMNAGTIQGFAEAGGVGRKLPAATSMSPGSKLVLNNPDPSVRVLGHMSAIGQMSVKEAKQWIATAPNNFSNQFKLLVKSIKDQSVILTAYTNSVISMTAQTNSLIESESLTAKQTANKIKAVQAEAADAGAHVELIRQLKILGHSDDEIVAKVNQFVANLNQKLSQAAKQVTDSGKVLTPIQLNQRLGQAYGAALAGTFGGNSNVYRNMTQVTGVKAPTGIEMKTNESKKLLGQRLSTFNRSQGAGSRFYQKLKNQYLKLQQSIFPNTKALMDQPGSRVIGLPSNVSESQRRSMQDAYRGSSLKDQMRMFGLPSKQAIAELSKKAKQTGELVTRSVAKGARTASDSKATIKTGNDIGGGLATGMAQTEGRVAAQGSKLGTLATGAVAGSARKNAPVITTQSMYRNQQQLMAGGIVDLKSQVRILKKMYGTTEKVILEELIQIDRYRDRIRAQYMEQAGVTKTNENIEKQVTRTMGKLMTSKEAQYQSLRLELKAQEDLAAANARTARLAQISAIAATARQGVPAAGIPVATQPGLFARGAQAVAGWWNTPIMKNGEPTGQTKGGRVSGAANGAIMGLMGLTMAASFAGGAVGEMAQKIMPVTFALMGLQMVLPLFTNPIGLAIVATSALVAAFAKARMDIDSLAKESARAGANIGGLADSMKIIEEATGFKGPNAQDYLFRFSKEDIASQEKFAPYFETENGKRVVEELQNATSEERLKRVRFMIAQAVGSGMNVKDAEAFGQSIASALGDSLLNSTLAADFANALFSKGSQALINLERQRLADQPGLTGAWSPTSFNTQQARREQELKNLTLSDFAPGANVKTSNLGLTIVNSLVNSLPGVNLTKPFADWLGANLIGALPNVELPIVGTLETYGEAATRKAAEGMGYALQVIQDLTNAEAVLEDERRNSLITYEEYIKSQNELKSLQEDASKYLTNIFSMGADQGAMMTALGNELSFSGFNEDQIKRITESFSPDALSQKFFGMNFNDQAMTKAQRDYVSQVLQTTLSGLSPQNISQRLSDIESVWAQVKDDYLAAASNAFTPDIRDIGNVKGFENWMSSSLGVPTTGPYMSNPAKIAAKRLVGAEESTKENKGLKELGTDAKEIQNILAKFKDKEYAKEILSTRNSILELGKSIVTLKKYEKIDLEFFSKKKVDPKKIVETLEKMSKIKFKKDGAWDANKMLPDPQLFVNAMADIGVAIDQIPERYSAAADKADKILDGFGKNVLTKMGTIKPKILPQIIAQIFGNDVTSSAGIANALNSAFPESLNPIQLAILLSLGGDEKALALLNNKEAMTAAKKGESTWERTYYAPNGSGGIKKVTESGQVAPWMSAFAGASGQFQNPYQDKGEDGAGDGGGEKEKTWLQQRIIDMQANAQLYQTASKWAKKLNKDRGVFFGLLQQLRTGAHVMKGGKVKTGYAALPEQLIEELGVGPDAIKRIQELLNLSKAQLIKFVQRWREEVLGRTIESMRSENKTKENATWARNYLTGQIKGMTEAQKSSFKFTNEELDELMQDPEWVESLRGAVKKGKAAVNELLTITRQWLNNKDNGGKSALRQQIEDMQFAYTRVADEMQGVIDTQQEVVDGIQEEIDSIQYAIDLENDKIRVKEREKEIIQRNIDGYERQNEMDQRRINTLQREDEMRNRVSSAIQHDLDIMSQKEQEIRDAYQKRIDALDQVAKINDYILNQQKSQISLAQAFSQGDVYAAAQAAQEMTAAQSQFAAEQQRESLNVAMVNQIGDLRTSQGLTRDQAEKQIADIKEQSYQTSLLIKDIEDSIYNRNLLITSEKDKQFKLDGEIQVIQDSIYAKESLILDITRKILDPAQKTLKALQDQKTESDKLFDREIDRLENMADINEMTDEQRKRVEDLGNTWSEVGKRIQAAYKAAQGEFNLLGAMPIIKTGESQEDFNKRVKGWQDRRDAAIAKRAKEVNDAINDGVKASENFNIVANAAGGFISGTGSRDSVMSKLTPGEYVVRKASVNKYGQTMLDKINMGSFQMPRYNVASQNHGKISFGSNKTNINAPVYNSYSINVPVTQPGASADEIANRVMTRIRNVENGSIRRINGYQPN